MKTAEPGSTPFGNLIRSYRERRGWSQADLAEKWGHTREYVSQIERGKRKVEKQEQIRRLAELLGIPSETLAAIGKAMPAKTGASSPRESQQTDALVQALLEPAHNTVKMSWVIWHGNDQIGGLESGLLALLQQLDEILERYRGQFYQPALRLQTSTHEMLGKMAKECSRPRSYPPGRNAAAATSI